MSLLILRGGVNRGSGVSIANDMRANRIAVDPARIDIHKHRLEQLIGNVWKMNASIGRAYRLI